MDNNGNKEIDIKVHRERDADGFIRLDIEHYGGEMDGDRLILKITDDKARSLTDLLIRHLEGT